jgi:hypothetical protein
MLVTLDIKNESMKDSFLNFIKTLDYIEIKDEIQKSALSNNKKNNKFSEFAGMWSNNDVTIDTIREKAWKK